MKTILPVLFIIALTACGGGPPNNPVEYLFKPRKACNHDVLLDNASNRTLSLYVTVGEKISDSRCAAGSTTEVGDVPPGRARPVHSRLDCVDCYVSRHAQVRSTDGALIYSLGGGAQRIYCDDSGCR